MDIDELFTRLGGHQYWKLDGKLAVPCSTLEEWSRSFADFDARRVAHTMIGANLVSTIFLGINHNFGEGDPLLFETMIFRDEESGECWRTSSWEEAEAQHLVAVEIIRGEAYAIDKSIRVIDLADDHPPVEPQTQPGRKIDMEDDDA